MEPGQAAPAAPAPIAADKRGTPDAVERIQAIINSEPGNSPAKRIPQGQPAQEQVVERPAQPAEQQEEAAAPNKQIEGEDLAADAPPGREIPLDELEAIELELVVKGEDGADVTEKVTVKDLKNDRMRQKDYSRKTAELARQREQLHTETRKAVEAERAKYLSELQTMHDLVSQTAASELGNVDWNDLAQNNAFEYVRLDNRKKQITQTLDSIRSKQKEVLAKHDADRQAAKQEAAAKARTQLESDIPGWNDTLYQSLMKAGIENYGYKQEEVVNWTDPRAFKLLHKATLFDHMQAEKKAPPSDKKVVIPPKVVRPGAVQDVNQARQREANAMKQLRTSGKIEDAAAVIRSRLG
ncbi:MAG: hypothetical protein EPO08_03900 [Rhodospirillaceae bacterium]|nr:MAG: hypothetical protein EPO08_03900 [Rhodospirillaceae bacterium]